MRSYWSILQSWLPSSIFFFFCRSTSLPIPHYYVFLCQPSLPCFSTWTSENKSQDHSDFSKLFHEVIRLQIKKLSHEQITSSLLALNFPWVKRANHNLSFSKICSVSQLNLISTVKAMVTHLPNKMLESNLHDAFLNRVSSICHLNA